MSIKALACELPERRGIPLSRFSISDIKREVLQEGLVASIGETTLWRWLSEDAIRPWFHRSWIFPRDPNFAAKGNRVLDLYEGIWDGLPLGVDDCVISADEKTGLQALQRIHPITAPAPGRPILVEHEYKRRGVWAYMAALDVRRAKVFGRCERTTGIEPFERLVSQVMAEEPYRSATRVFWILDNGSSHRGQPCIDRMKAKWPTIVVVHTPTHASWLNQVEIYFSVVERKALTPKDFPSLSALEDRLLSFQEYYEGIARPFRWHFTRRDLATLMAKLDARRTSDGPVARAA